jgi:DNA-binding MarR family transcriptional regulator
MPATTEVRTGSDVVAAVEVELTLLGRHAMHSSQHTEDRQLDRSGYHLLGRLQHAPLSLRQLAEAFRLDQSTVNRQVNRLLASGLVERIADPDGGTALLIRPTTEGTKALARDRAVARDQVAQVLDHWPDDEVAELQRMLRKFNTSIEELEGTPWPRG